MMRLRVSDAGFDYQSTAVYEVRASRLSTHYSHHHQQQQQQQQKKKKKKKKKKSAARMLKGQYYTADLAGVVEERSA